MDERCVNCGCPRWEHWREHPKGWSADQELVELIALSDSCSEFASSRPVRHTEANERDEDS